MAVLLVFSTLTVQLVFPGVPSMTARAVAVSAVATTVGVIAYSKPYSIVAPEAETLIRPDFTTSGMSMTACSNVTYGGFVASVVLMTTRNWILESVSVCSLKSIHGPHAADCSALQVRYCRRATAPETFKVCQSTVSFALTVRSRSISPAPVRIVTPLAADRRPCTGVLCPARVVV